MCYENIASGANFSKCFAFSVLITYMVRSNGWAHMFDAQTHSQQLIFDLSFKCSTEGKAPKRNLFMTSCAHYSRKKREMSEMISRFSFPFEVIHKPTVIDIDGFNEAFLSGIYHFHIVNIIFKLCENKIERKSKRKSH